jgi:hypothetical protein
MEENKEPKKENGKPIRRYRWNEVKTPGPQAKFDYEGEAFVNQIYDLALDGYYDWEIARKVGLNPATFCQKKTEFPIIDKALTEARAHARDMGVERPSPKYFQELIEGCEGKVSRILDTLGIGYRTLRKWCKEDKRLQAILDVQSLEFVEQLNMTGKILSLGIVNKDNNQFPGWAEEPNAQVLMFYLNSIGAKYGFGKNAGADDVDDDEDDDSADQSASGIDISRWITRELQLKREAEAKEKEDDNDN